MGLILLAFLVCIIIAANCAANGRRLGHSAASGFWRMFSRSGLISSTILCIILYSSYYSYVDMQERLVNINAYKHTIKVYIDRASMHKSAEALTDLKYQNYQQQLGDMLKELRQQIVIYNSNLVGKSQYKKSWFWNWLIFAPPEGSKVLNMADYIN